MQNCFIKIAISAGLTGFLTFIACYFYPEAINSNYQNNDEWFCYCSLQWGGGVFVIVLGYLLLAAFMISKHSKAGIGTSIVSALTAVTFYFHSYRTYCFKFSNECVALPVNHDGIFIEALMLLIVVQIMMSLLVLLVSKLGLLKK